MLDDFNTNDVQRLKDEIREAVRSNKKRQIKYILKYFKTHSLWQ